MSSVSALVAGGLVVAWAGIGIGIAVWSTHDAKPVAPQEAPAVQALRDAVSDCGKGQVLWQSSRTNEVGVVWYTMRCEVHP